MSVREPQKERNKERINHEESVDCMENEILICTERKTTVQVLDCVSVRVCVCSHLMFGQTRQLVWQVELSVNNSRRLDSSDL